MDQIDVAETAINLWAGYSSPYIHHHNEEPNDSINNVAALAKFVPAVLAASAELDRRLAAGYTGWSKVFHYDVTQEAGAWLGRKGLEVTQEEFAAKLKELTKGG